MIIYSLKDRAPVDYTSAVAFKLDQLQSCIDLAREDLVKECPYDLEHVLYMMKSFLREAIEIVNKVADYYEVASELKPKKEDVALVAPLKPKEIDADQLDKIPKGNE